jgi:hypothetical protein
MAKSANDGILIFSKGTIIPTFQNSIVPAPFWQNAGTKIISTSQARFVLDTTELEYYFQQRQYKTTDEIFFILV